MKVSILDGTLRDGGYVNNWQFASDDINYVISNLIEAKIDFIELGFLKPNATFNTTIFDGISNGKNPIINFIKNYPNQNFSVMINVGELENYEFIKSEVPNNLFIRLAFRKEVLSKALKMASDLKSNGINVFINPMFTNSYSKQELSNLIKEVNNIKPYAFSIVDTAGAFTKTPLLKLAKLIDKTLNQSIILAFHSHNNLNLSLENALSLTALNLKRELIIESCISGMGRGAGNLDTILITQKLGKYPKENLQNIAKKITKPIYTINPWGITNALYYSAKYGCHPDYGIFLENEPLSNIRQILAKIPENHKYKFNKLFTLNS